MIANWLTGKDASAAFAKPFGDSKCLTDAEDVLLYTDIPGVKSLRGMKAVYYQMVQARMGRIRRGNRAAPAVVIVRSSLDEPAEEVLRERIQEKGEKDGRVYFVEVAIGNLGWHRIKVVIWGNDERPKARLLWYQKS